MMAVLCLRDSKCVPCQSAGIFPGGTEARWQTGVRSRHGVRILAYRSPSGASAVSSPKPVFVSPALCVPRNRSLWIAASGYVLVTDIQKRLDLDKSLHSIRQILPHIMHERFCCNHGFAALGVKRERIRQDVRNK
jgi:hypothetical protein